jgi:hypothetical protein
MDDDRFRIINLGPGRGARRLRKVRAWLIENAMSIATIVVAV